MANTVKVTLVRSPIGTLPKHKATLTVWACVAWTTLLSWKILLQSVAWLTKSATCFV